MKNVYRCIHCHAVALKPIRANGIECAECRTVYPVVEGVPVFVSRANDALSGYAQGLTAIEQTFAETTAKLQQAQRRMPASAIARRAQPMIAALEHNLSVMRAVYAPVIDSAREREAGDDFIAWASIQTGLSLNDMFVYFYQDWAGVPDFEQVKSDVRTAIAQHATSRQSVAVLGAGACGLAHALVDDFERCDAVDLSLPTLIMVQRLLGGQRLRLHIPGANWRPCELVPPAPSRALNLVTANVTNLPYPTGSLSSVVTQCLMDIVDNPLQLVEEIQRVLAPNGLWVNFSHAFGGPGEQRPLGPRKLDEVPELIRPYGFEPVWLERKRFVMLNVERLDPEPPRTDEEVHFFGFRKTAGPVHAPFRALRESLLSRNPELWARRLDSVPGREVSLSERRSFGGGADRTQAELRVGIYPMPIPNEYARLLSGVLEHVAGRATLRELFDALRRGEPELNEQTFLDLIYCLTIERYVIDLTAAG